MSAHATPQGGRRRINRALTASRQGKYALKLNWASQQIDDMVSPSVEIISAYVCQQGLNLDRSE